MRVSPSAMRRAMSSTIFVLPTPAEPFSSTFGLFLLIRTERTCSMSVSRNIVASAFLNFSL